MRSVSLLQPTSRPPLTLGSVAGRLLPTWYLRASGLVPPPTQPTFSHGQRGKPYLATPEVPGLDFNTTHEGAYVLLAVVRSPDGEKAEVGVDVMDLPAEPDKLASEIDHVVSPPGACIVSSSCPDPNLYQSKSPSSWPC